MSKIDEKRLWIIEARDGAWGANGICKGELVRCGECIHRYVDGENVRFNVCELNHNKVQADYWFCADGERRTDDLDRQD